MFNDENVDMRKSKAKCTGAKKTTKVLNAKVQSTSGAEYTISMTVAKNGKVTLTTVSVAKSKIN